uniref:Amiloride-sensitive sodium channel n=2 Tax=Panagrellus redivivus TaxID=6233 RepID=A0A7E4UXJ2_PANRE
MTRSYSNASSKATNQNSGSSAESPCPENPYFTILDEEASYFTSFTTFHGMVRIYNSKTWISLIFWVFVVTICVTLFFYYSGDIIYRFAQKSTYQIYNYASYGANDIPLPFLLVCPLRNSRHEVGYESLLHTRPMLFDIDRLNNITGAKLTAEDFWRFRKETAKGCHNVIGNMMYGPHTIQACSYVTPIFYEQMFCMRLDLGKAVPKTLSSQPLKIMFKNMDENGYEIYIQPRNRSVYESSLVTILKPNHRFAARSTLRKKRFMHRKDGGKCTSSWTDVPFVRHQLLLTPKINYSMKLCEHFRLAAATLRKDNCVLRHMAPLFGNRKPICDYIVPNVTDYRDIALQYKCIPQCEYNEHKLKSILNRPLTYFEKRGNNNKSILEISFTKLYHRTVNQMRQLKALDILCKLGGNTSLFFGFSMITLMETFMFLLKVIIRLLRYKPQKVVMESEKVRTPSTATVCSIPEDDRKPSLPIIDHAAKRERYRSATISHCNQFVQIDETDDEYPDVLQDILPLQQHRPSLHELRNRRILFRRQLNSRRQSRSNFRHKDSTNSAITDPGGYDMPASKRMSIVSVGQASLLSSAGSISSNLFTLESRRRRSSVYNSGVGGF